MSHPHIHRQRMGSGTPRSTSTCFQTSNRRHPAAGLTWEATKASAAAPASVWCGPCSRGGRSRLPQTGLSPFASSQRPGLVRLTAALAGASALPPPRPRSAGERVPGAGESRRPQREPTPSAVRRAGAWRGAGRPAPGPRGSGGPRSAAGSGPAGRHGPHPRNCGAVRGWAAPPAPGPQRRAPPPSAAGSPTGGSAPAALPRSRARRKSRARPAKAPAARVRGGTGSRRGGGPAHAERAPGPIAAHPRAPGVPEAPAAARAAAPRRTRGSRSGEQPRDPPGAGPAALSPRRGLPPPAWRPPAPSAGPRSAAAAASHCLCRRARGPAPRPDVESQNHTIIPVGRDPQAHRAHP